jgi:hypothetical protein
MIDTDKYEGHTEGPWQFDGIECVSGCGSHPTEEPVFATLHVDEEFMLTEENMLANGKLIADAPLLLAEVKRLREVQKKIGSLICDECGLSIEEHIRYHTENDVIAGCPFGED